MANDSSLDDQSFLPDGETIVQGEGRRGSPAQKAEVKVPNISGKKQINGNSFFLGLSTALGFYFIELFIIIAALPSAGVFYLAFQKEDWLWWILMLIVSIPLFEITFWIMLILVKHLIIGKTKPGIFPINSIIDTLKIKIMSVFLSGYFRRHP